MVDLFQKLPTVLTLSVLVGIFISLKAHVKSPRIRFWIAAWTFIFLHFFSQLFEPQTGLAGELLSSVELGTLLLSGAFFIVSLTKAPEQPRLGYILMPLLVIPLVTYSTADSFNLTWKPLYLACLLVLYGGGLGFAVWRRGSVRYIISLAILLGAVAAWGIYGVLHGDFDAGLNSELCAVFTVPAILFWRRFPRWSPGVGTTVAGFFAWGAVFPAGTLTDALAPNAQINGELWNVPKFFVAFGMILSILEEKSTLAEQGRVREHEINLQLQSFADLTSRLLSGVNFDTFCNELAQTLTRVSNFQRAAILLSDESRRLYLAGHSGVSAEAVQHLQSNVARWRPEDIQELCTQGRPLGRTSWIVSREQMARYAPVESHLRYEPNPYWNEGDEVLLPLLSPRGHYVGCISLDDPRDPARVTRDDMGTVELLAGDLAVAVENSALHRQLLRSEKLAAIGQLVAGVAHELNNPLTSVIGYGELIADDSLSESSRQRLETLKREAQRMKRIVQNLLRFARQSQPERKRVSLADALNEVIALREYNLKTQGIRLASIIASGLPPIEVDEDQLKHVLINVIGNAIDAVKSDGAEKQIKVEAFSQGDKICMQVSDSGPGFADLDRALDPFYTTKPVGEGTGLGLSICYGIVNGHGGEIRISNLKPRGACVTIELPVAGARPENAALMAARA